MVSIDPGRRFRCPACADPTPAPALCAACDEAFALARRAHPASIGPQDQEVSDDLDLWDAWSLLGDVGGRPR